jgi:hypothetical protein
MGNITREIVNRAEIPVLVVRSDKKSDHGLGGFINHLLHRPTGPTTKPT